MFILLGRQAKLIKNLQTEVEILDTTKVDRPPYDPT